jgi:hypothetical protein
VGHDDHARVRKHVVERRDELALCCSVHWALSDRRDKRCPAGCICRSNTRPEGLHLRAALSDALASPVPRIAASREAGEMVRTEHVRLGQRRTGITAFPVYAGPDGLSRTGEPGRHLQSRTGHGRIEPKGNPSARRPSSARSPGRKLV